MEFLPGMSISIQQEVKLQVWVQAKFHQTRSNLVFFQASEALAPPRMNQGAMFSWDPRVPGKYTLSLTRLKSLECAFVGRITGIHSYGHLDILVHTLRYK